MLCAVHACESTTLHDPCPQSHSPNEAKQGWEAQAPCPRSHLRDSPWPSDSGNCALSGRPRLPVGCGESQPLLWVDMLVLCLCGSDTEPPGRVCRERRGQSPEVGLVETEGSGQQAGVPPTLPQLPPPTGHVTQRLQTHFYFGRAFGPHLHVLFFLYGPKCGALQSTDVSAHKNRSRQGALCGQTFSCSQQNHAPLPSALWEDVWKKCQGLHFSLDLSGWN